MKQYISIDKHTPLTGALDFSWLLDAPAGKHGFVRARNGHLYFEDGKRARFIGFNFPVRTALPDHESAEVLAKKMAGLGVNVLRLCAADAPSNPNPNSWAMDPGYELIDYSKGNSRSLNPAGVERFDYFAKCLKDVGIYLHFDLSVARGYPEGDELDYPPEGGFLPTQKMMQVMNRRLIELQKEFATQMLTHVNPYTGLAYIDDPQVMTIQVINEDSMFINPENMWRRGCEPYNDEMQRRFNYFLLAKYGSRKHLKEAWTNVDGVCALGADEDPEKGTVKIIFPFIPINAFPNRNDVAAPYDGERSPARFGDLNDFGVKLTRDYYREMFEHIRSLGAKVPIAASNLIHGCAEVYAASEADVMENNSYWNHPFGGHAIPDPRDRMTTDPRFFGVSNPYVQPGHQEMQLPQAVMLDKPFIVTEWNEYGSVMYNGASFPMVVAYACLQDWDGLIIYSYHTAGHSAFDQDHSFVADIMESYNDPALICLHGTLSAAFLREWIAPAKNQVAISHTMNDLGLLPYHYTMPYAWFAYVSKVGLSFLNHGEHYRGDADVAVSSGYTPTGDYTEAKHAVIWAGTEWADATRRYVTRDRFYAMHENPGSEEILNGAALLGDQALVIRDFDALLRDRTLFSQAVDAAMKKWGILDADKGLQPDDTFVSDTGELRFSPKKGEFTALAGNVAFSAGAVKELKAGRVTVSVENRRMTMSVMALDGANLTDSRRILLSAVGEAGNDKTHFEGKKFVLEGRLMMDALEGRIAVSGGADAEVYALGMYGERVGKLEKTVSGTDAVFTVTGENLANFEIVIGG